MMRAALNLAADHPAFSGHFPAFPVLPGAVLLDAALAAIAETRAIDITAWQIASVKFLRLVRPGDALAVEHEAPGVGAIRFTIRSQDRTVAAGTLSHVPPVAAA
jgi:3-hydroxymyristoyl/3-hydroxydecanoyl-(acyl carrier protein) dehydratase